MGEMGFRVLLRLLEAVPLRVRALLFEGIAMGIWAADARHRRIARINLRLAFPEMGDAEASRIIRRSYARIATSAAEFVEFPRIDGSYVERRIRAEGIEHLRETVRTRGMGPLVMTGHFGNWELLAHAYAVLGGTAAFVVRPLKNEALDRIFTERREWVGNRVIRKVDFGAAKEVLREVRRMATVGILIDQNQDRHKGVLVDFFTRKAYTTDGIARLALALRTNIHPGFIFRDPKRKFHHTIRFGPPLPADFDAPREEEVLRLTRRCNEELEKAIREDPDQWFWIHRRWRARPPGEANLYRGGQ